MIKLMKYTFFDEKRTKEALCRFIMQSEKLSLGEQCDLFEESFAKWQGRKYCVTFNSGSSANLALLQALLNAGHIKKGSKIGFSAVTWATDVMPIIQLGCVPVPIDIEIDTLNVSSKKLLDCKDLRDLDCLLITNLLGFCGDLDEIRNVCSRENILLLEDNCESMGSIYKGTKLGNFGYASTFSTYVGHHLSTIEGGMVCTDDEDLYEMLKMVRAHGWDRNLPESARQKIRSENGITDDFWGRYTFYVNGYNLRPTEIGCFLGNYQLPMLDATIDTRSENFRLFSKIHYRQELFYPLKTNHIELVSNFAVPVVCRNGDVFKRVLSNLEGADIEVRPIVGGCIVKQPFYETFFENRHDLKNSIIVNDNGFYFGNNSELTMDEKTHIITTLCNT